VSVTYSGVWEVYGKINVKNDRFRYDIHLVILRYYTYRDTQAQCSKVYAHGPLLVYNSALGNGKDGIPADRPSLNLHWTRYYTEHRRGEGGELPVLTAVSEVMAGVGVETPRSVAFHDVDPYPNHPQQPPGKSDAGEEHRVMPVDEETQYIGGI